MDEDNNNNGWLIGILIVGFIWAFFFHKDKYEEQTAEEWFNDYDEAEARYEEFRNCVEDYDSFDIDTQIEYGGVFYYCE